MSLLERILYIIALHIVKFYATYLHVLQYGQDF